MYVRMFIRKVRHTSIDCGINITKKHVLQFLPKNQHRETVSIMQYYCFTVQQNTFTCRSTPHTKRKHYATNPMWHG